MKVFNENNDRLTSSRPAVQLEASPSPFSQMFPCTKCPHFPHCSLIYGRDVDESSILTSPAGCRRIGSVRRWTPGRDRRVSQQFRRKSKSDIRYFRKADLEKSWIYREINCPWQKLKSASCLPSSLHIASIADESTRSRFATSSIEMRPLFAAHSFRIWKLRNFEDGSLPKSPNTAL